MVKWSYPSFREQPWLHASEPVRNWFESLPDEVQAAIDSEMGVRTIQSLRVWREKEFHKALEGDLKGLEELRFELRGKDRGMRKESYRILGYADEATNQFVMLAA